MPYYTGYYATPATRLYLAIFVLIGTVCRGFLVSSVVAVVLYLVFQFVLSLRICNARGKMLLQIPYGSKFS